MKRDKENRFTASWTFCVNVDSIMDKAFSIFVKTSLLYDLIVSVKFWKNLK